ncbi:MAG: transposase, partial [Pseudogulbenkiania sp.]|nr:transposase [Pseudogulbenkiania sp.]
MPAGTRLVDDFTPEQLRFPPAAGFTVRADFAGGEGSSDLGALVLGAVDRRIGLIERLTGAIADTRDPRYITHPLRDLLTQRVFQIASGYLRPGKRPTGAENAMIMKRVLGLLRRHWPQAPILLRGDGHFANPELMALIQADGHVDFLFGLLGNPVLARQAEGLMKNARGHLALHQSLAARDSGPAVAALRQFGDFDYAAGSWPQAFRVVLKAEVLAGSGISPAKDNARFVVTTLRASSPRTLYQQDYCSRGQAENLIKQVKV